MAAKRLPAANPRPFYGEIMRILRTSRPVVVVGPAGRDCSPDSTLASTRSPRPIGCKRPLACPREISHRDIPEQGRQRKCHPGFKNRRWQDLGVAQSKPYAGLADVEFSAVGHDLVLEVEGEVLIHVKDASLDRGKVAIGTVGPNSQARMADLRLQVLDGTADAPAAGRGK
jgi:hypothetical protein